MPIKSFRGKIEHSNIDTINLHTTDGSIGYRIIKFEMMPVQPAVSSNASVTKIYKIPQTLADGDIDFSDNTLLAAGFLTENSDARFHVNPVVVFDNEIFNQDIFITYFDVDGNNGAVNYYIELEQIKLDLNSNTVATLKDIRNISANE